MSIQLARIINSVNCVSCEAEFGDVVEEMHEAYGVHAISYVAHASRPGAVERGGRLNGRGVWRSGPDCFAVSSYSEEWAERYRARGYVGIDPVVGAARDGFMAFDWAELDWSAPAIRRFREEAREFGVAERGLGVPLHAAGGAHAVFTVNADLPERDWAALVSGRRGEFMMIASAFQQRVAELHGFFEESRAPSLSEPEHDVLARLASGERIEVGASSRPACAALRSARRKLGARTAPHAVALGVRRGLICV